MVDPYLTPGLCLSGRLSGVKGVTVYSCLHGSGASVRLLSHLNTITPRTVTHFTMEFSRQGREGRTDGTVEGHVWCEVRVTYRYDTGDGRWSF